MIVHTYFLKPAEACNLTLFHSNMWTECCHNHLNIHVPNVLAGHLWSDFCQFYIERVKSLVHELKLQLCTCLDSEHNNAVLIKFPLFPFNLSDSKKEWRMKIHTFTLLLLLVLKETFQIINFYQDYHSAKIWDLIRLLKTYDISSWSAEEHVDILEIVFCQLM